MTLDEYQELAERTIPDKLSCSEAKLHAIHGMVGEIGEINSIYQKVYQGHPIDTVHIMKELGDLMWFISEYCSASGWELNDICEMNINKLRARYPDGFDEERSLNREDGDI